MQIVEVAVVIVLVFLMGMLFDKFLQSRKKSDGAVEISKEDTKKIFQFEINIQPEELESKRRITFDVVKIPKSDRVA